MAEEKKVSATKADKQKPAKKDKPSLPQRIGKFFRDYKSELKKIVWASPKQTLHRSVFVAVVVIIFGAVIGGLDIAFHSTILKLAELL